MTEKHELVVSGGIEITRIPNHTKAILWIEWKDGTMVELWFRAIQTVRITDDAATFTQGYFAPYCSTTEAARLSIPRTKKVTRITFTTHAGGNALIKGCCVAGIAREGVTSGVCLPIDAYYNAQRTAEQLADLLNAHILKEGLTAQPAVTA